MCISAVDVDCENSWYIVLIILCIQFLKENELFDLLLTFLWLLVNRKQFFEPISREFQTIKSKFQQISYHQVFLVTELHY